MPMVPAAGNGHILQPGSPKAADEKHLDQQPEELERAFLVLDALSSARILSRRHTPMLTNAKALTNDTV